jgi:hypothetical protein
MTLPTRFSEEPKFVVAEFPLKKRNNNQSTNADFLFRAEPNDWILVEMKTEKSPLRLEQMEVYTSRVGSRFSDLLADLTEIESATNRRNKYKHLLGQIEKHKPYNGKIRVLYITPHEESPIQEHSNRIEWCSFKQLFRDFKSIRHPELWKYGSKLVDAI